MSDLADRRRPPRAARSATSGRDPRLKRPAAARARRAAGGSALGALAALVAATLLLAPPAWPCGPNFPNRLFADPDAVLLTAPAADFARELTRLTAPPAERLRVVHTPDGAAKTREIERDDLELALNAAAATEAEREAARARLQGARDALDPALLEGLAPTDLREYARGAILYARGDVDAARVAWLGVLALPPADRARRSVWAAYMLGRSYLAAGKLAPPTGATGPNGQPDAEPRVEPNVDRAAAWFARARALAAEGFEDRLGLAATSLGWEARARRDQGRIDDALSLYLAQAAHGDPSGVNSVAVVARELLTDPAGLEAHARSATRRPVVTAWLLARAHHSLASAEGDHHARAAAWVDALADAGVADVPGADRLAWLAYRVGRFDLAARWLAVAPADSAITLWTRARLALRDGDVATGAELLARVIGTIAEDERWGYFPRDEGSWGVDAWSVEPAGRARGELAILALSRGELARAADLLLRTDYLTDAAWVAERVLTIDELAALVAARWPEPSADAPRAERERALWIRNLLGRRMVRSGRLDDARPLLRPERREALTAYAAALSEARDATRPRGDRARAWWTAATLARHEGMALMGTELDPDWHAHSGRFAEAPMRATRTRAPGRVAPPTADELARAERSAPEPDARFHYRYVAGEHVWQAVKLLPRAAPEAGPMLCHAAEWVLNRDPPAAQRFYREYLRRSAHSPVPGDFGRSCPDVP